MLENQNPASSISQKQYDLLQEEINNIKNEYKFQKKHTKSSAFQEEYETQEYETQQEQRTGFNSYADKQLMHLVLIQEFNFEKISEILKVAFRHDPIDMSQENCRQRWTQIYKNRKKGNYQKEKAMEDKRIQSIMAFTNPYSLYDVQEFITTLQKNQAQVPELNENQIQKVQYDGYNIFKDNFRKISDWEQYNKREKQMKEALSKAQMEKYQEEPLLFTPVFQKLEEFEVKGEQLTTDKVKKLLAYQIEMEKVSRQLNHKNDLIEEEKYEGIIKRRVQMEKKLRDTHDLEDNWDQYESD